MKALAIRAALIATFAALMTGCGNLQAVRVADLPAAVKGRAVEVTDVRPTKEEAMPRAFEVPGRSLFIQQTSGGSAAAGILLGPLGALASGANIDRITNETGESAGKSTLVRFDALAEAKPILEARFPATSGEGPKVKLKPYVVLLLADEAAGLDVLVHFRAESDHQLDGKPYPWVGYYTYYLDQMLPLSALKDPMSDERREGLRKAIQAAYSELAVELERDLKAGALPKRDIAWVKSRGMRMMPGDVGAGWPGDIERSGSGRMVLRSNWGDYGRGYKVMIFANAKQYEFDNGPVARQ